jgi:hypothetical protein
MNIVMDLIDRRNGPGVCLEVLGQDPADCARWPSAGGGARASEPPNRT